MVNPAVQSYCEQAARLPLSIMQKSEENKVTKNIYNRMYYKAMGDISLIINIIHFEPFVIESGGQFGEKAQQVMLLQNICNLVTQSTGQCGSNIAYFLKSKLLVTLARSQHNNFFQRAEMV